MARCAKNEQEKWRDVQRMSRKSGEMCGERAGKVSEMCGERERAGNVARCAEKEKEK